MKNGRVPKATSQWIHEDPYNRIFLWIPYLQNASTPLKLLYTCIQSYIQDFPSSKSSYNLYAWLLIPIYPNLMCMNQHEKLLKRMHPSHLCPMCIQLVRSILAALSLTTTLLGSNYVLYICLRKIHNPHSLQSLAMIAGARPVSRHCSPKKHLVDYHVLLGKPMSTSDINQSPHGTSEWFYLWHHFNSFVDGTSDLPSWIYQLSVTAHHQPAINQPSGQAMSWLPTANHWHHLATIS